MKVYNLKIGITAYAVIEGSYKEVFDWESQKFETKTKEFIKKLNLDNIIIGFYTKKRKLFIYMKNKTLLKPLHEGLMNQGLKFFEPYDFKRIEFNHLCYVNDDCNISRKIFAPAFRNVSEQIGEL